MAPTQCSIEASAGSDTECQVAPQDVPQVVPPQGSGVDVYAPNTDASDQGLQIAMAQEAQDQFFQAMLNHQQSMMPLMQKRNAQYPMVNTQQQQAMYSTQQPMATTQQQQAMYSTQQPMVTTQHQPMVSQQQPMINTQQQPMISTQQQEAIQAMMPPMSQPQVVTQQYPMSVQQPLTVHMGNTTTMPQPGQFQSPLNIHATPFQPSGPNSAATTACSSPANFHNNHMAPENYATIPQQAFGAPEVPLLAVAPGTMPYPMYHTLNGGPSYPVPVPNMAPGFGYHGYHAPPYQYLHMNPNNHQFVANSSNGSSPAPDLSSSYGSNGSYISAPADLSFRRASLPYEQQAVIPLANGLDRLQLNNAPMYQPPKGHNMAQTSDMKQKWHGDFAENFGEFQRTHGHTWELHAAPGGYTDPHDGVFEDSAKIRFICKTCSNAWTSMQGKVKFWYSLSGSTGSVHFQLFGQKCRSCKQKRDIDNMQDPLWYPDEISKVVYNICAKVSSRYYGAALPHVQIHRRVGHPRGQHDSSLCDACEKGLCRRAGPNPSA